MAQLTIVLRGERSPSRNKFWSSPHWSVRSKEAKRIHALVQGRLLEMGIERGTTCNKRVEIEIVGYFDKKPLDCSNVESKPYEDGLIGWLIVYDSIKWVDGVTTRSRIDKANPRVEITLTEVEE